MVVYMILGFGRSSRPNFSNDAQEAERELVNSIEEWRREVDLERFALLGHSMGGFLATSYAMRFPDRYRKKNIKRFVVCKELSPFSFSYSRQVSSP